MRRPPVEGLYLVCDKHVVACASFSALSRVARSTLKRVVEHGDLAALPPVFRKRDTDFAKHEHEGTTVVAVLGPSSNVLTVLELLRTVRATVARFVPKLDLLSLRARATLILEIMHEVAADGLPQAFSDTSVASAKPAARRVESKVKKGRLVSLNRSSNEIFVDVNEVLLVELDGTGRAHKTPLLMHRSSNRIGPTRHEISGRLMCDVRLAHFVPCSFAFDGKAAKFADCGFDASVKLDRWASDGAIVFTPPQRLFELMRYRVTEAAPQAKSPLAIAASRLVESSATTHVLEVRATYLKTVAGTCVVRIPVPHDTEQVKAKPGSGGTVTHEPHKGVATWRSSNARKLMGGAAVRIQVEVTARRASVEADRRPTEVEVFVPGYSASDARVKFFKVDPPEDKSLRWVRHLTHARFTIRADENPNAV